MSKTVNINKPDEAMGYIEELNQTINELKKLNDELVTKLNQEIEKNESLAQDKVLLLEGQRKLFDEAEKLQNKLKEAEDQNKDLKQAVEEITKANILLQEEVDEANAKIESLDEHINVLESDTETCASDYVIDLEEQIGILRKALKVIL